MNNDLKIFESPEFGRVRVMVIDGEPMFVGKDVSLILGYVDVNQAIKDNVDKEDRIFKSYNQLKSGGFLGTIATDNQSVREFYSGINLINESGIYSLVFGSKLQSAKKFKKWVTSEVLPSIRKNGGYITNQENMTPEQIVANALIVAQNIINTQKKELEEAKPKIEFYDAVTGSSDTIDMRTVATVLNLGVGRNAIFEILRDCKILDRRNIPYQTYIDRGYFRTVESSYTKPDGTNCVNIKTVVFQKGLDFIRKIILKHK